MKYKTIESDVVLEQIKAGVEKALGFDAKYTITRSKGSGTKETIYLNLHALDDLVKINGDSVTPRIVMLNSYRGECAFGIHVGFIRWVCSNGMVGGDSFFSRKIIHRIGPTAEEKLAAIQDGVYDAVCYMRDQFAEDVGSMTSSVLTEDQMISVVGSLPQLSRRSKDRVINLVVKPVLRRSADRSNNLWILWNLVNEEISRARRSEVTRAIKNTELLNDIKALAEVA